MGVRRTWSADLYSSEELPVRTKGQKQLVRDHTGLASSEPPFFASLPLSENVRIPIGLWSVELQSSGLAGTRWKWWLGKVRVRSRRREGAGQSREC